MGFGRTACGLVTVLATFACSGTPTGLEGLDDTAAWPTTAPVFYDPFDNLDPVWWLPSSHQLGRGYLLPGNVTADGRLRIRARFDAFTGGELSSSAKYGTGSFTARMRCATPAGTVCALFLYQTGVGNSADEIDIEILPGTREVMFTAWQQGTRTFSARKQLGFDPAAAFHSYTIERATTELRFRVDGVLKQTFRSKTKVPQALMPVFLNAWWPTWLTPGTADGLLDVDEVTIR